MHTVVVAWAEWAAWAEWICKPEADWPTGKLASWPESEAEKAPESPAQAGLSFLASRASASTGARVSTTFHTNSMCMRSDMKTARRQVEICRALREMQMGGIHAAQCE
jgi:hypothetical protein